MHSARPWRTTDRNSPETSADFLWLEQNLADVDPREAFTCIDRIDEAVSQDVYTNQLRFQVALAGKDFAKTMEYAKKVVDAEPDLVAPYWAVVYAAAQKGDFADAVAWLKKTKDVDPDEEYSVECSYSSPPNMPHSFIQEYLQFLKEKDRPAREDTFRTELSLSAWTRGICPVRERIREDSHAGSLFMHVHGLLHEVARCEQWPRNLSQVSYMTTPAALMIKCRGFLASS